MFDFFVHVASIACLYGILALSLNLQAGFTGLINFGLIALFGCGTYGAALANGMGWHPLAGLPLGVAMAAVFGLFYARLGRKLSSDYWGIATLSIAEIFRITLTNEQALTGGAQGISGLPLLFAELKPYDGAARLVLYALVLLLVWFICQRIVRSSYGLAMKLTREEPQLARSLGYNLDAIRRTVMLISSAIAAIAGFLYAHYLTFVGPDQLVAPETFLIWSMVIIGGIGNNWGVVAGAIVMQFAMAYVPFVKDMLDLPTDFVAAARLLIVGGGLLAFLLWRPKGLFPEKIGGSYGR
ncbi:branched-chain amino acid ABC transporter permease [Ochrobactrum teleogrylli]|uniref:Branched-chain amino acid ABC transporter permease n=1 Tax=Ochrobactrum teleogrylli TaxID=2479765 RepID=A0ABY2Y0N1_9HYPH|nr:branched-chain amino acid ABC transporter permease [[Ochrobactrum] teleogrylli]TNV12367.1 branched-chain amino acid ABC transporter permease [[Ochrobactrum] teleogrylli]